MSEQVIRKQCTRCDYKVELPLTPTQVHQFDNGDNIQDILPNVSPGDREMFISGICGDCFDKLFLP